MASILAPEIFPDPEFILDARALSHLIEPLTLLKAGAAVGMVLGLSALAERVNPRFAGVFSGFPLGSAISLFFIGYELGPDFAAKAAVFSTLGLTAILCFAYGYYLAARRALGRSAAVGIAAGLAGGLGGYVLAILVLERIRLGLWTAALVTTAAIIASDRLFGRVTDAVIEGRPRTGYATTLLRGAFAAAVIVAVTTVAHWVGPAWAGLLAAFPTTLLPFLVIIHFCYRPEHVNTILKNLPRGLFSLVVYCVAVALLYPKLGVGFGTVLAYALASAYLVGISLPGWRLRPSRR
jgi:branched-subunit amino acid transport protein AzlD